MSIVLKMKQKVRDSFAFQRTSDAPYHAVVIHGMLCFSLLCLLGLTGCPQPTTDFSRPPVEAKAGRPAAAFVFIVDGVNGKIFNELLAAGKLPNFKKYFIEQGAYTPRAIANVPSVTLANLTSIVTGKYPAHHGVLANNWFDRENLIFRDYNTIEQKNLLDSDCKAKQVYEFFPSDFTASIFLQPHKGASKFFENTLSSGPAFFFGMYELMDDITMYRFPEMMGLARAEGKFPKIVCAYLLAPDFTAYTRGLGEQYRNAIIRTDGQIGKFMDDLKTADLLDKVLIAIVSDHSHGNVTQHFPLKDFLTKQGWNSPLFFANNNADINLLQIHYYPYKAVVSQCGEQYAAIYLCEPVWMCMGENSRYIKDWTFGPTRASLEKLTKQLMVQEGMDVVAFREGKNKVVLENKRGKIRLRRLDKDKIQCEIIKGGDPFGFGKEKVLSFTAHEWLERTHDKKYPNLPVLLMSYFDSEKAGDIVLFAAPGWDFNGSNKAGHGGVRGDEDLRVPMLLRGPGVPQGKTIPVAQTVDLLPTLLKLMGEKLPNDLDGRPLFMSP